MTIFHVLVLAGFGFGLMFGERLGLKFGNVGGVVGAIIGGGIGFMVGRLPFFLVLKSIKRDFSRKTVEELRMMLRDPGCFAPNTVLLELGSRGEDLEQHLPIVLEMLMAPSRERRIRGWHALVSAFPERTKLIADYRVDDSPSECQRKIQKLRISDPGTGTPTSDETVPCPKSP